MIHITAYLVLYLGALLCVIAFRLTLIRVLRLPNAKVVSQSSIAGFVPRKSRPVPERTEGHNPAPATIEHPSSQDLQLYRSLFHQIHNLEEHPDVLPLAHRTLGIFIEDALRLESDNKGNSILRIKAYDRSALEEFLAIEHDLVSERYIHYLDRRKCGGPPELFRTKKEAEKWLIRNAPVKFVDGAWLGSVHQVDTPYLLRSATEIAYQTLLEELGNGVLEQNHVYLYDQILRSKGIKLPSPNDLDFVQDGHGMDQIGVWKNAVGQLLLGLFAQSFLPETLGFNLHFELLTLGTLKAAKELPLFGFSALYFLVHISVDNAHSGHTAMALEIVERYLDLVEKTEGREMMEKKWKRVQAGFALSKVLGEGEDVTSRSETNPVMSVEGAEMIKILRLKATVSSRLHCASRVKIGEKTLADWLDPVNLDGEQQEYAALKALGDASPWIVKGDPGRSRLVKELVWGGKMFGAFTASEVAALNKWIDSLERPKPAALPVTQRVRISNEAIGQYLGRTGNLALGASMTCVNEIRELRTAYRSNSVAAALDLPQLSMRNTKQSIHTLLLLWFTHPCLLENMVRIPFRMANPLGSCIVRIVQAENGFSSEEDGVHGIDESKHQDERYDLIRIGRDLMCQHAINDVKCLSDVLIFAESRASAAASFSHSMLAWSKRPVENFGLLLGLSRTFLELERQVALEGVLSPRASQALMAMIIRKERYFEECVTNMEQSSDVYADFFVGSEFCRSKIEALFTF